MSGNNIPLPARIFSIVDYWDALLSNRPYRSSMGVQKAEEIIRRETGHHFDPAVAEMFLKMLKALKREGLYREGTNAKSDAA